MSAHEPEPWQFRAERPDRGDRPLPGEDANGLEPSERAAFERALARWSRRPAWCVEGARVAIKATREARASGVRTFGQFSSANDRAWPGEIGTVHGDRVWFSGGRELRLTPDTIAALRPVRAEP